MFRKIPAPTPAELLATLLPGDSPPAGGEVYAGYGRFLLRNLLLALGWPRGTKILVPAYVCDVLLLPLAGCGMEPVFYGVGPDFRPDFSGIPLDAATRGIITVSYFGCGGEYGEIAAFARRHGLCWIHDNAHGFASADGGRRLEEIGDVSITSFRKTLPCRNGARMRLNSPELGDIGERARRLAAEAGRDPVGRFLASGLLALSGVSLRGIPDYDDLTGFRDDDPRPVRIDPGALRMVAAADEGEIREARRRIYRSLEEELLRAAEGIALPVPGLLRPGNAPQVLPVRVSPEARRPLLAAARRGGIDLHTWPSLPAAVVAGDLFSCVTMWRNHLFFPIHQRMDGEGYLQAVRGIVDAVRAGRYS